MILYILIIFFQQITAMIKTLTLLKTNTIQPNVKTLVNSYTTTDATRSMMIRNRMKKQRVFVGRERTGTLLWSGTILKALE